MKRLFFTVVAFLSIASSPAVQDLEFDATVVDPGYRESGPVVCIDEAHRNYHTAEGRYAPLVRLLENDGYSIVRGEEAFGRGTLSRCDVLVIANAQGAETPSADEATDSAFTEAEIAAVDDWVADGGSLLLIADHAPFGAAAANLAHTFGIRMVGYHLKDESHADAVLPGPYFLRFERSQGMIGEHPITDGRGPDETISVVVTFGGQALEDESGQAISLLSLSDDAVVVVDPRDPSAGEWSAAGLSHALARDWQNGRVVVVGEAGLLSAQVIRGEAAEKMGLEELRFGMTRDDTDDRQFVLNVFHWLSRLEATMSQTRLDPEMTDFATRYAAAWSSQDPELLASFYAPDGSLIVNNGTPSVGREAIAATAKAFMTGFPDMVVKLVELTREDDRIYFHWEWTGTNTGPGGTGHSVEIRGYEVWSLSADGLIQESDGHYDQAEFQRQVSGKGVGG